jgi:hypothetical protein
MVARTNESFPTGKARAIGPHIPTQWKLPAKPVMKAMEKRMFIFLY